MSKGEGEGKARCGGARGKGAVWRSRDFSVDEVRLGQLSEVEKCVQVREGKSVECVTISL